MTAVDAEVGVGGENDGISKRFGHAHQARVGEAHWHVGILVQELQHRLELVAEVEARDQGACLSSPRRTSAGGHGSPRSNTVEALSGAKGDRGGFCDSGWNPP